LVLSCWDVQLGYFDGYFPLPPSTNPYFLNWHIDNVIVRGWSINSMHLDLIGNSIRFLTKKTIWDAIATTYFDNNDTSQVYELQRHVTCLRQSGGSLKKYCTKLKGLWHETDFRRPNPRTCTTDIQQFNQLIQDDRVYTFLDGLDDRLDNICSYVLQMQHFPSIE